MDHRQLGDSPFLIRPVALDERLDFENCLGMAYTWGEASSPCDHGLETPTNETIYIAARLGVSTAFLPRQPKSLGSFRLPLCPPFVTLFCKHFKCLGVLGVRLGDPFYL